MTKVLAISGSLRKASLNTAILQTLTSLNQQMQNDLDITLFEPVDLEAIPHFNPDRDIPGQVPESVLKFRSALIASDIILISSPEYVGGVAGALKNAFDWVVSSSDLEVYGKPFALLNISNRATKAYEDLKVIVKTMGGNIIEPASKHIPLSSNHLSLENMQSNPK